MYIDCFFVDIDEASMRAFYDANRLSFLFKPVPLIVDNGTEGNPDVEYLGFHLKIKSEAFNILKSLSGDRIFLYHELDDKFRDFENCPKHVFGSGGSIVDAIDPNDLSTFVSLGIKKDYAKSMRNDDDDYYKFFNKGLKKMTKAEKAEKGIEEKEEIDKSSRKKV